MGFGIVMIGMTFVKTWEQLVVLRALLGLFEAGFFPGCVFLISTWYTRFETQKRLAIFYLSSMVISAFANIIGLGITKLGGVGGLAGEYFPRFRVVQTSKEIEIDMILRNSVAMDFFGFWTRDLRTGIYGLLSYWCVLDSCDSHRFVQLTY
jgi:MFS family permease